MGIPIFLVIGAILISKLHYEKIPHLGDSLQSVQFQSFTVFDLGSEKCFPGVIMKTITKNCLILI